MVGIKVKVRHVDDSDAADFCEVPWGTDLEEVMDLICHWGAMVSYDEIVDKNILVGQFILDKGEFFFEIVLGWDDQ